MAENCKEEEQPDANPLEVTLISSDILPNLFGARFTYEIKNFAAFLNAPGEDVLRADEKIDRSKLKEYCERNTNCSHFEKLFLHFMMASYSTLKDEDLKALTELIEIDCNKIYLWFQTILYKELNKYQISNKSNDQIKNIPLGPAVRRLEHQSVIATETKPAIEIAVILPTKGGRDLQDLL